MKTIILKEIPKKDVRDGLLVMFAKETDTETRYAFADIYAGQTEYHLPSPSLRKIERVYVHLVECMVNFVLVVLLKNVAKRQHIYFRV